MFSKWLVLGGLISPDLIPPNTGERIFLDFAPSGQNTYTWLRTFYSDFGLIGVVTVPFFFGILSSWLAVSMKYRPSVWRLTALAILMPVLLFSIMGFRLTDIEQLGAIIAAVGYDRLLLRWTNHKAPEVKIASTQNTA
jgi:oligosaccharide repeat unit polymerase